MKIRYIILAIALVFISCDSYLDIHKEYITGGEIVYLQKVDSVVTFPGRERIQFKLWYTNGNRLTQTIIYYNNGKEPIILDLKNKLKQGKDSLEVSIDAFPEGNYNFEIVNTNEFNQKSLTVAHFASTYGKMYEILLKNRGLRNYSVQEQGFNIEWFPQSEGYAWIELEYKSATGTKTVIVEDASSIAIAEIPIDNLFRYRTFYRPEPGSIDVFTSDWSTSYELE